MLILPLLCFSKERRNLLIEKYSRAQVAIFCENNLEWVKYPSYYDRAAWESVPENIRNATISAGEKYIGYEWPNMLASDYLEFSRTGDRNIVDVALAHRLSTLRFLFYAELMEGKGRFIDDIVNGLFTYFDQTYWGMSATFYLYEYGDSQSHPKTKLPDDTNPVIDLTVGDVASTISWIWYYLHEEFDKISPVINKRLIKEMREKVLEPYYSRNDFWWITGWNSGNVNNWTPWCSYNVLTSILLLEPDPQKRLDGIYKSMRSVDLFINSYPADGGCNEGPSYWGHGVGNLFNYLNLLRDCSNGKIDIFAEDIIGEMGRYIYKLYVSDGVYFVNFADAPGKINQDGIRIARFGQRIGDPELEGFGEFLAVRHKDQDLSRIYRAEYYGSEDKQEYIFGALTGDVGQSLSNLFDYTPLTPPAERLLGEAYLKDLQVAIGRDQENSNKGFFFAAKGGNNAEQHNHNDVGSFVLFYNGTPVFVDPGVGTYTRQTFSDDRYGIWAMRSDYHNLPVINGVTQHVGGSYRAEGSSFTTTKGEIIFSTDIAKAYPEEANVSRWERKYTLDRRKSFTIKDSYSINKTADKTIIVFITPNPVSSQDGFLLFKGEDYCLKFSYMSSKLDCGVEEMTLEDSRLSNVWGDKLFRIVFSVKGDKLRNDLIFKVENIE